MMINECLQVPLPIGQADSLLEFVENNVKPRASLALINFLGDVSNYSLEQWGTIEHQVVRRVEPVST